MMKNIYEAAPKDGTEVLIYFSGGAMSAVWKKGTRNGRQYEGWMGCHGKWIEEPKGWMPLPSDKTGDIQLSQNDAAELVRALKTAIYFEEQGMWRKGEGTYRKYCENSLNMVRRVMRELQKTTGNVMIRVNIWSQEVKRTKP